jgi:hypothetical protein
MGSNAGTKASAAATAIAVRRELLWARAVGSNIKAVFDECELAGLRVMS